MITLIRYIMLCQKRVKFKLALYNFLEQELKEVIENKDDLQRKLIHELVDVIHTDNQNNNKEN